MQIRQIKNDGRQQSQSYENIALQKNQIKNSEREREKKLTNNKEQKAEEMRMSIFHFGI